MNEAEMSTQAVVEMRAEAKRLKQEFEDYLEDLELFSKLDFWKAIQEKAGKTYRSVEEYAKDQGLE